MAGRWQAESLPFLFQAHGFRGKARFVLFDCCMCEGSHTLETGREVQKFEPILFSKNNVLTANSSDSQSGNKFRDDRVRHARIIKG
jgi:hypothetical protein